MNHWLIGGFITFIIIITILFMGEHGAHLALVGTAKVLRRLRWRPILGMDCLRVGYVVVVVIGILVVPSMSLFACV